jgi:hypothetical protein
MAAKVGLGDPVYRAAVERLAASLPASPTGRWVVLCEKTDLPGADPHRFAVAGPFGSSKAVDVAAEFVSIDTAAGRSDRQLVRVVAWLGDNA